MNKILNLALGGFLGFVLSSNTVFAAQAPEWLPEPNATEATAVKVGNLVFISGQASGDTANTDNTGAALEESLEKIKSIANQMGGDMNSIVKLDLYLTNFDTDFALFDKIFPKYFSEHYPTRTAVGVSKLSKNHTVAINAIMYVNN